MAWVFLVIAGVFECFWAVGLKYTDGFARPVISLVTLIFMVASFWLLSAAMKTIPVGTAYAVWTGIGAAGVALAGILLFQESRDITRILCILLIVTGVIGLRVFSR
ncbi:DMT family transporter [Chlorobium phaeobacteroides]|jgi:quaternary ammonium compound-resistance protein SugE|uniref:Guanidinium exporter n=1 Tax=Chlorobium phaeobacteroides (strain DSM 266 / SMG 266 / 2430) TaxID=290317 RepID=A1BE45_CHLPD|nr:quaternary ammonium compound efflux SMR transporter SugE [Chlorobium phaeobacteroides]ABL64672.1 small multidrug resistance protein [Chlorobium phaeobacteroides DSM 266]MBV5326272.1 quaternary ammonium compound efflux SMR transporter SugE [Chlorobium sp.]